MAFISAFFLAATTAPSSGPAPFEIVGHIDVEQIPESSGVVASRKYPGVFWTHNDSGNPAAVFAISAQGKLVNEFNIAAKNVDWEDIAIDDEGRLYLADIGDNNGNRNLIQVYRIAEPDPKADHAKSDALRVETTWRLRYPLQPFDAESLFVLGGNGYIISKLRSGTAPALFRFSLEPATKPVTLEKILDLPLRAPVTAADVSRDGKWLAVMTVLGPFVFQIDADVNNLSKGPVWQAVFVDANIEGVCFIGDNDGLLATTEGRKVIRFNWRPTVDRR